MDRTRQRLPVTVLSGFLGAGKTPLLDSVLIGQYLDPARIGAALRQCTLTDQELAAGPGGWETWEDPFALWEPSCETEQQVAT